MATASNTTTMENWSGRRLAGGAGGISCPYRRSGNIEMECMTKKFRGREDDDNEDIIPLNIQVRYAYWKLLLSRKMLKNKRVRNGLYQRSENRGITKSKRCYYWGYSLQNHVCRKLS